MKKPKFGIKDNGEVYLLNVGDRRLLGHIACVVRGEKVTAQEARKWWHEQLASDRAIEVLDETSPQENNIPIVQVPASTLAIDVEADQELAELALEIPVVGWHGPNSGSQVSEKGGACRLL